MQMTGEVQYVSALLVLFAVALRQNPGDFNKCQYRQVAG